MMAPRNFPPPGPKTEAGKHVSSQNAVQHGLTGKVHAALRGEEDAYAAHCQAIREALAPAGILEEQYAQDIAADRWRLARARHMEHTLFEKILFEESPKPSALAEAWVDPKRGLQRIALYAARIQRAIEKNTAKLEAMQAARQAAHAKAAEEAILLTQLAQAKGETYDPAPDFPNPAAQGGFVYSAPEIAAAIGRAQRLDEAKTRFAAHLQAPASASARENLASM